MRPLDRRHIVRLLALGLVAPGGLAPAQTLPEPAAPVRFGFNESPPIAFTNDQGQPEGWLVRVASAMLDKAGLAYTMRGFPAARLVKNLQNAELDVSLLVRIPALEASCLFSRVPIAQHELRAYRVGRTPPARGIDDFKSRSVITLHGYSYAGFIDQINDPPNRIRNEVTKSFKAGFAMLEKGRADYLLAYEANVQQADVAGIEGLQFDVLRRVPIHIVVSRSYPDAERMLARLEALIKTIDVQALMGARR